MYRAGLESILGVRQRGASLRIDPCIPRAWPSFSLKFRYRTARYDISVENPRGVSRGVTYSECDGTALAGDLTVHKLQDDGLVHSVKVVLG
jgi:cyclic beta-1,2-glucan synthetase